MANETGPSQYPPRAMNVDGGFGEVWTSSASCADLVAWGPFHPDIAQYLEYETEAYRSTMPGVLVVAELFGIVEGTYANEQFAACLGISDVWDFNQHKIDPEKIDVERLRSLLQGLEDGERYAKQLQALLALRASGFQFVFRPNG